MHLATEFFLFCFFSPPPASIVPSCAAAPPPPPHLVLPSLFSFLCLHRLLWGHSSHMSHSLNSAEFVSTAKSRESV